MALDPAVDRTSPYVLTMPAASEADFYALGEDSPFEFLDGRLVMSPSSLKQEDMFRFLLVIVSGWLDERGGGVALGSRYPMRLDDQWSPEPDLLVVTDAHRGRLGRTRVEGPADLVIEIASDGDPKLDEREKRPRYLAAEVPEMWWISPQTASVLVDQLRPDGYRSRRVREGRIESTVLPGLWIDPAWLTAQPLPSAMGCLREVLG